MEGIFTISLDFELHWGVFDKRNISERLICYENTLNLVPRILQQFSNNDIHVTWATVGSLFAEDESNWHQLKPEVEPDYVNEKYSAYKWINDHGFKYRNALLAREAVTSIPQYQGQELGTHTFSHYYCLEQFKHDAFAEDLGAVKKAAATTKTEALSLVFPRNQFNANHLQTCFNNGIRTVRTNPSNWFWSPVADEDSNIVRKVFRTGDAYIPVSTKRTSYPLNKIIKKQNEPLQLPASRFLRPWHPSIQTANSFSLKRVLDEMTTAAKKNEVYHLWWHPENFGDYPEENMRRLEVILGHYKKCKNKFGMMSWNMADYITHIN